MRTVILPAEHGGWSLTLEPAALGLIVAPSGAGFALGAAAILAFLLRTPLRVILVDRWRRRSSSSIAWRVAVVEGVAVVLLVIAAVITAEAAFWWPFAVAAPLIVAELWHDMRSRGRRLVPELAGSVGIGSVAAAIALAGGESSELAAGLWIVIAARAVAAVLLIRVQLRRTKQQEHRMYLADAGQAVAIVLAVAAWAFGWIPIASVVVVTLMALYGVVTVRLAPQPAVMLGAQQVVVGLTVVLVTGLAARAPW